MRSAMRTAPQAWNDPSTSSSQTPGRANLLQLGGSESTGTRMVRPGQWHIHETYPCSAARVVCGGAAAFAAPAGLDSRSLPAESAHGGHGRIRAVAHEPLFGADRLDRPACGSARDQGQDRDSTGYPQSGDTCADRRSRASADSAGATPSTAGTRYLANTAASGGEGYSDGSPGDRRLCGDGQAARPESAGTCPAPTAAPGARVSPATAAGGRAG